MDIVRYDIRRREVRHYEETISSVVRESSCDRGVQVGYFYYKCPNGQESVCRKEWSDLRSVAGKHQVIGIRGRHSVNGRVRKADEKPAAPDMYVLNVGVVPIGAYRPPNSGAPDLTNRTQYGDLIAALEAALKIK